MIILTVYTLYLEDNFFVTRSVQTTCFDPKMFIAWCPNDKFKAKLRGIEKKFFILPILASKMIILTVYTLYLEDNFFEDKVKYNNFFGPKMFIAWCPNDKFKAKLRGIEKKFHILPIFGFKMIILTVYTLHLDDKFFEIRSEQTTFLVLKCS